MKTPIRNLFFLLICFCLTGCTTSTLPANRSLVVWYSDDLETLAQNDLKDKEFILFTIGARTQADQMQEILSLNGQRTGWNHAHGFDENWTKEDLSH